jgi:hypothetical protein
VTLTVDWAESSEALPDGSYSAVGKVARERIVSFGVIWVGIFAFLFLHVYTVRITESLLDAHFQELAEAAVNVANANRPIGLQIQEGIQSAVLDSYWVTIGGAEVRTIVLANDGVTWLYVDGQIEPPPDDLGPTDMLAEAVRLLPATVDINVSVSHTSLIAVAIAIFYAYVLLQGLYIYNTRTTRQQTQLLDVALKTRDSAARRAADIETELQMTRQRLREVEPLEQVASQEILTLESERGELQQKLVELAAREEELRGKADRAIELTQEVGALEDLLDEAGSDLEAKNVEIQDLEQSLKRASKGAAAAAAGRGKAAQSLARRVRTLYKTLEVDDRAIDDLVALRDETMMLKAEEKLKRLSEEAENVAVRRKVGGLPDHLHIFELGFAGKGRIYYTRGKQRRFRIMAVGAKNTQDADLDYLRRLGRDEMA